MWSTLLSVANEHNEQLVVLAGLICFFSCYTAFNLIAHAGQPGKLANDPWLIAAGVVTGCGIWAAQFVSLLAFQPGVSIGYEGGSALLAAAIGIVVSAQGFALAARGRAAVGGLIVGLAITGMNYAGMSAMRIAADEHWNGAYLALSYVIAASLGTVSFKVFRWLPNWRGQIAGALLLTIGTLGMHFSGMAALSLTPSHVALIPEQMLPPIWFTVAITAICVLIMGMGVIGSLVDAHIKAIESAHEKLEETTQQLTVANETKSRFLATVSHELRTPLNAILGFSEILKDQVSGPIDKERILDYATHIFDSGSQLLNLVNEILDISKFDARSLELYEEDLDLGTIVASCVHMMESTANEAKIRIHTSMPNYDIGLRADERRLRQILLNLISNAVKFTPEGGRVYVTANLHHNGVAVVVSDTGIGMTAEDIPVALERFGQIDSRLSRKYNGTGLGLPISKHLVELHGGTLDIASEAGRGTTVTVVLPPERLRSERRVA